MLVHDRRVVDVPLEERLKSRTSELVAWFKTFDPVINQSVRDARAQIHTGHQDIRSYRGRHRNDQHYTHHRDRNAHSSYQRVPPSHSAALSGRTNQDSHDLCRHSPVISRWQQRRINPSDRQQHQRTRIDKLQYRSRVHTCRRSGSNYS
jgi:hypothetical protein